MTPENSLVTTKARDANPLVKLKIWGKRLKSVRSDQIHSSNKIILDTFTLRIKKEEKFMVSIPWARCASGKYNSTFLGTFCNRVEKKEKNYKTQLFWESLIHHHLRASSCHCFATDPSSKRPYGHSYVSKRTR